MQTVFKRYELKFILSMEQKEQLLACMQPYMSMDQYGRTEIRNLYFDTPDFRLIRRSVDRPSYKEKLRLRSYGMTQPDSAVFVELKKKCDGVVYKRRLCMDLPKAMDWLCEKGTPPDQRQITKEVDYFLKFYGDLRPTVYLSYEREAYFAENSDFRVTFDHNIICRQDNLTLCGNFGGHHILPADQCLVEIKCSGGSFIGTGATGMAQNFSTSSTQCAALIKTGNQSAGTTVMLKDSSGKVLISYTADRDYSCVIVSIPEMAKGGTYTLTAGTYSVSFTMSSTIYSAGGGSNRPGGR